MALLALPLIAAGPPQEWVANFLLTLALTPTGLVIATHRPHNPNEERQRLKGVAYGHDGAVPACPASGAAHSRPPFSRRRHEAARMIDMFNLRLRDQIDLETLSTDLLGTLDQTMQPPQLSLWLRPAARQAQPAPWVY